MHGLEDSLYRKEAIWQKEGRVRPCREYRDLPVLTERSDMFCGGKAAVLSSKEKRGAVWNS